MVDERINVASGRENSDQTQKITGKGKKQNALAIEQKILALDTFAFGIAQDFNEILAAIMGYVEMALLDSPKASSVHKNLKHAMQAAERAKDLVTDLQAFGRQKELERKSFQLAGFVKDTLDRFAKSLPLTIKLQDTITVDAEFVNANPTQIHQIVINLCTNACNAMLEDGGVIKLSLDTVTIGEGDEKFSYTLKSGSYIRLRVSDTGKGIDEKIQDRIFDPYFTTIQTGAGYGMGLAIVQSIVDALFGFIEVESNVGVGTVFTVYLPVESMETI